MTPSSAFPADTGHTAPGASNRGSARHQRGRRSTRKPDLTAHVEPEHAAGTAPSVAVRKTADGAHRPSWGTDPVRYTSVDTSTQRPPARQGDTSRDREKRPAQPKITSQRAGFESDPTWPGPRFLQPFVIQSGPCHYVSGS